MKKIKIHPIDLEEVMVYMTEKRTEYEELGDFDIHQEFYQKFGVTSEQFENLLSIILLTIDIAVSAVTNQRYLLLADKEKGEVLLKIPLEKIFQNK